MKKPNIDKLLDALSDPTIPKPNPAARKQAIKEATEIFNQGLNESSRPIEEPALETAEKPNSIGIRIMNFLSKPNENRTGYHAFGTIAVVVAVASIALMAPALFDTPQGILETTVIDEDGVTVKTEVAEVSATPAKDAKTTGNENKSLAVTKSATSREAINKTKTTPSSTSQLTDSKQQIVAKKEVKALADQSAIVSNEPAFNQQVKTLEPESLQQEIAVETLNEEVVISKNFKSSTPSKASAWGSTDLSAKKLRSLQQASPRSVIVGQSLRTKDDIIKPTAIQNNREEFADYKASSIKFVAENPISTFSVDVDTASYSFIRNQLNSGRLPSPQAVRIEELINYFDYDYPLPSKKSQPFSSTISVQNSPWNADKKLVHIGIKGYEIAREKQPDSNLVFLLDVSGSMGQANKLPLVKQSLNLLLDTLKPSDTISIVVYAGAAGAVLEPTKVKEKAKILTSLRNLQAGGSTAGGAGIRLAYQLAEQNFNKDAVNRIIIATDGDFNVGQQSNEDLKTLVERKRESGVFLSILGFGRGNYQDDMMQTLAQNGNGIAAYIDTLSEAKKVLVDEASSTLFTIAKDVKLQVEFNPITVSDYRLIGYETRALKKEDFNNDKVDAGDIGAGHTVTAIYEITPREASQQSVDKPRYTANQTAPLQSGDAAEYGFLKIRYKLPDQSTSRLIKAPINIAVTAESVDANFSIAVAGFGQLLANSQYTGKLSYDDVIQSAQNSIGKDPFGYRSEFIQLVRMAKIATP